MRGKNPPMNSLALRKQLLVLESELNRAQFVHDWEKIRKYASWGSALTPLISGLRDWQHEFFSPRSRLHGWRGLLRNFGWIGALWPFFANRQKKA